MTVLGQALIAAFAAFRTNPEGVEKAIEAFVDQRIAHARAQKQKGRELLPDNFPDAAALEHAMKFWREKNRPDLIADISIHADEFRTHHEEAGTKAKSWPATWRTWYQKAVRYNRPQGALSLVASAPVKFVSIPEWVSRLEMHAGLDPEIPRGFWNKDWPSIDKCPAEAKAIFEQKTRRKA